jgi:hypothetical protein
MDERVRESKGEMTDQARRMGIPRDLIRCECGEPITALDPCSPDVPAGARSSASDKTVKHGSDAFFFQLVAGGGR